MTTITPVPAEGLAEHFKRAQEAQQKEARRERRFGNAKTALIVLLAGGCGFLAWRNEMLTQQAAENANRVIFVTLRDDGTLVNTAQFTSLPARYQTDNTLNSLWWYVQWRECYSQAEAPRAHYAVQRMSDERVRKEWLGYIEPSNPNSPQVKLGKQGHYYRCEPVAYWPIGRDNDRYGFRFLRYEVDRQGNQDAGVMMTASVAFRTGIYPEDENAWKDKVTFNAPGIQVWEYPGARPDAVQQHLLQPRVAQRGAR